MDTKIVIKTVKENLRKLKTKEKNINNERKLIFLFIERHVLKEINNFL